MFYNYNTGGDENSAQNLRKLAEENPKAKATLLYKAEIQDRKHELVQNEEEFLKILHIVDGVLKKIEQELDGQVEGMPYFIFFSLEGNKSLEKRSTKYIYKKDMNRNVR